MLKPQSHKPEGHHWPHQDAFDDSDWSTDTALPVRPLTRQEAQALAARHPSMTVWQVLAAQAAVGVLVALVWGAVTLNSMAALSALYGAAVVVVPSALMARGVFGRNAGRSVGGLLVWEVLKLGLTGAMLALAPVWIQPLNWAAMLVNLVLCMKVIGVILLLGRGREKNSV
jgi:ATP synthase protein I